MLLISKTIRFFAISFMLLALSMIAIADTVRLRDGSIIKGRIVSFGNGKFIVEMGDGARRRQMTFTANEVESIQFDSPVSQTPTPATSNRNASYDRPGTDSPKIVQAKAVKNNETERTGPTATTGKKMQPIEWQIKVLADNTANGWTNSGWVVRKGQRIRITGEGKIILGQGKSSTSSGLSSLADEQKLLKNVPTGALIAVIGDDNNDFIYVGSEREFTATRDGALFLGINEGYLEDNSGSFDVKIEILPDNS
ncbi:MAG: hypothetical protein ABIV48_07880 [Pyrinomonadaceae bacterium]